MVYFNIAIGYLDALILSRNNRKFIAMMNGAFEAWWLRMPECCTYYYAHGLL